MDASRPKVGQSEGEDAFKKIETLLQQLNTAEKSVAERDGKIKELENELLEAQTAKDLNVRSFLCSCSDMHIVRIRKSLSTLYPVAAVG